MGMLQTCWRWAHRIFWYSLAGAIVALAIVISLARIFIPDLKLYRTQIENVASTFLAQEVRIESMDARMAGMTPLIIFKGVRMLDDSGRREIIRFDEARLGLDIWHSLTNRKVIPRSLTVYGVKLAITRRKDNTLTLQGLNIARLEQQINAAPSPADVESNELARWLFERSTLSLKHSTVVWYDALHGNRQMRFDDVNLDIRNDGDRHQFTGLVTLPQNMGNYLSVAFDFKGNILNPALWHGHFYSRGNALQIGNWGIKPAILHTTFDQGLLDVELWGEWQAGAITSMTTEVNASTFHLSVGELKHPVNIKLISGLFDWQRLANGWRLNASKLRYQGHTDIWPESALHITYSMDANQAGYLDAYSGYVHVADVARLVRDMQVLDKAQLGTLEQLAPKGELSDLHIRYRLDDTPAPEFVISTGIKDLSIRPYKKFPGGDGLDGVLWTDQQHGMLALDDSSLQLELPSLFRKPFELTRLTGAVQWWHAYDAWHIATPGMVVNSKDVQTDLAMNLDIPEAGVAPVLDLQGHFVNGDAQGTPTYLPVGIMQPELVHWLDNGIVSGHVKSGGVLFHGRVSDFPFTNRLGTFVVNFAANDVLLNYQEGWPAITAKELEATFTGKGMLITATTGALYNSGLHDTTVKIDRFALPVLTVETRIAGNTADAIRFLVESPIAPAAAAFHAQSKISGESSGQLALTIPLNQKAAGTSPTKYNGYLELKDNTLRSWQNRLVVTDIGGRLDFSPRGVFSDKLAGRFTGNRTRFNVFTKTVAQHQIVKISMDGVLNAARLPENLPLNNLEKRISGQTPWHGVLSLGSEDPKDPGKVNLHISSKLDGLSFDLPPPLQKPAKSTQDFRLNLRTGSDERMQLDVKIGDILAAAIALRAPAEQPFQLDKGVIQFSAKPVQLPAENELVIRGSIPLFPIDEWQAIKRQLAAASNMSGLDNIGVPVVLDLDLLKIVTREDAPEPSADDPRKVSLLNGEIRDLTYDDMQLGHLTIKTSRHKEGMRFDQIKISAPFMEITGEGSWLLRQGQQRTNLLLNITTEDVGSMISRLGYKGVIRYGTARAVWQLNWADAPNRFSFDKLNGTMGSVISDGVLNEVDPGAGRLLGLMSLTELPRRLLLDFSELRTGLNFKHVISQFDIVDGDAFTENLHIISPIALIDIDGRTGLAKRDYDLDVSVAPNVSTTLPVISWLAWGGQIGALTFLIDQLFGAQFNESIASQYRVSGTWEHPEITQLPKRTEADKTKTP